MNLDAHPIADLFPMLDGANADSLVESMRANGYDARHPILTLDGKILDGRNRYKAARVAGVEPVLREFVGKDPLAYVVLANITRRHLDESQRAMVGARIKAMFEADAKARQIRKPDSVVANLPPQNGSKAREKAAAVVSVSPRSVQSASTVLAHGTAHLIKAVDEKRIPVSVAAKIATEDESVQNSCVAMVEDEGIKPAQVAGMIKLAAKRELAEEIRANPIVTLDQRYQVIAIDPPWKYDSRAEDTTHRGKNLYPDMTVEEICAVDVGARAQEDCVLWLWTTNAFMRDAYRCLDAWGFKEKTILTWDKELLGLGDWLRNVTEHCILAVRGKPVVSLTSQATIIREKRREHSRKPEAFYALVEQLCPGSKLEMFSREARSGWAAWGAEVGKF